MPETLHSPNANPLALIRSLPTSLIPLDKIAPRDDLVEDEIFLAKYTAFLVGKTSLHETRISLSSIRRGFWKQVAGEWKHIEDPLPAGHLEDVIALVRLGDRPALHIYESPYPNDDKRFVCADDCVTHRAYETLGIAKVPVVLMAKPRALEESCLSLRCFPRAGKDNIALLEGIVSVTHEAVPSVLGKNRPPTIESLERLLLSLANTKESLKRFHQPGATKLHYHHTLYSVLLRAQDAIEGMKLLIAADKPLTAAGLLRSLYELVLVFYADWLAPNLTYRYLQIAAVQTEKQWKRRCEEWQTADIASGTNALDAKNIKDAHMRAFRLGCVIGERARLFPLGESFQRDVYGFLSDVIHHDFSMTARYAYTLDHGDDAVYHDGVTQTIAHLADILVAAIVVRVQDDIGNSTDRT